MNGAPIVDCTVNEIVLAEITLMRQHNGGFTCKATLQLRAEGKIVATTALGGSLEEDAADAAQALATALEEKAALTFMKAEEESIPKGLGQNESQEI